MNSHSVEALHKPLIPILRHVLAAAGLPRNGVVLDLASGSGLKLPLLRDACGPHVTLLALDRDHSAVADCATTHDARRTTHDARRTTHDARMQSLHHPLPHPPTHPLTRPHAHPFTRSPAHPFTRPPAHPLTVSPCHLVTGDAHALPLVDNCVAAACCIAAWSLFADPVVVLHELRRVVAPGGAMLIVSGTQAWAEVTRWPPALAEQLQSALARAHAAGMPRPSAPDVSDEIVAQFAAAGLPAPQVGAFLLGTPDPAQAELALLPWRHLRAVVAPHLDSSTLCAADEIAAMRDIELCTVVIAVQALV